MLRTKNNFQPTMHKNQIAAADHQRTHSIMRRKSGGMAGIRHMTALLKEAASLIPDYPGFEALCADSLLHAWESDRCTGKRELHNRHRARGAGSGLMRMNWKGWQCVRSGAVRLSGREVAAQRLRQRKRVAQNHTRHRPEKRMDWTYPAIDGRRLAHTNVFQRRVK